MSHFSGLRNLLDSHIFWFYLPHHTKSVTSDIGGVRMLEMVDVSKMIRTFLPGGESLLEWRCMSVSVTASEHGTNMCLEPKLMETELYLDLI